MNRIRMNIARYVIAILLFLNVLQEDLHRNIYTYMHMAVVNRFHAVHDFVAQTFLFVRANTRPL